MFQRKLFYDCIYVPIIFLQKGPKMPFELSSPTMVTSPSGQGVILIGGFNLSEGKHSDTMIELTASMKWKTLEQKLKYPRDRHVTLPIPYKMTFKSN